MPELAACDVIGADLHHLPRLDGSDRRSFRDHRLGPPGDSPLKPPRPINGWSRASIFGIVDATAAHVIELALRIVETEQQILDVLRVRGAVCPGNHRVHAVPELVFQHLAPPRLVWQVQALGDDAVQPVPHLFEPGACLAG